MQQEVHEPYTDHDGAAFGQQAVALGDRVGLHIGDYVGFERITPNSDWRLALGKVVGFPASRFVKVAYYDPVNRETVAQDPISEDVIRKKAEEEGRMQLWHNREALREELSGELEAEKSATADLFASRDATLAKQAAVADMTKDAIKQLHSSRKVVRRIPSRQWRDLRARGEPTENMVRLMRAVMLVLYEDKAVSWEEMDPILKDPNFLDRMLAWDCAMTPMSHPRRSKIVALCSGEDLGSSMMGYGNGSMGAGARRRSSVRGGRRSSGSMRAPEGEPPAVVPSHGTDIGVFAALDAAVRTWLNAQLAASEAAERQERAIDECFAEQQEQRVQLRKVNDMRTNISRIEVMMQEGKCAIMGTDPNPNPIMPLDQYPTDTIFYKRIQPGTEGRFVQEIILRDAVIINFGPMAAEDTEGYVRLTKDQTDALRTTVHQAYIKHDADEMQDLLARKEREEEEVAQLRSRIDALRERPDLTDEELEELGQLERLLEDAERRHRATLARIAELYACGRGAREITMASKRIEAKYTRLHCKMAGDWTPILGDPKRVEEMKEALRDDICKLLQIPREAVFDIDARAGSLFIDFTVKHNGEHDDEELQNMVNNADFSALSLFYEKVTFKKTGPINLPEQQAKLEAEMRLLEESRKRENFSGMGIKEKLEDYYNADGTLDEEFGEEITSDGDYRKAIITIPLAREDFEEYAIAGPAELYCDEDQDLTDVASPPASEDDEAAGAGTPQDMMRTAPAAAAAQHGDPNDTTVPAPQSASLKSSPTNVNDHQWDELSNKRSSRKASPKAASVQSSSHRTPQEQEAPQPVARAAANSDNEDEL